MAMGPAYQLSPYVSLDPQQAASADPLNFQTQQAVVWQAEPSTDFQTQQAAEYQPESHPQADNMPRVVISHTRQDTSIFCNDWSHVHINYKISTASGVPTPLSMTVHPHTHPCMIL